jgi:nucleotide-binding universal stress UspA family protein
MHHIATTSEIGETQCRRSLWDTTARSPPSGRSSARPELCTNDEVVEVVSAVRLMPQVKGAVTIVDPIEAEEAKRALEEAGSMLRERGISAKLVEGHGEPGRVIAKEAEEAKADLIVVGTHGRRAVGRAVLGSVSTGVLHQAHCDVLVVR